MNAPTRRRPPWALPSTFQRAALLSILRMPEPVLRRIAGPPHRTPEGAALDLQTQVVLRLHDAIKMPEIHKVGLARARRMLDRSAPLLDPSPRGRIAVTSRRIPGPVAPIEARIYTPESSGGPLPVLVYFHGGGFAVGSLASHDALCRAIAVQAEVVVVSVDYRLAPEHRFPAAVDDAVAATRWVLEAAPSFGGDPRAVAVGGDSAGGNLAAVVAQILRADARRPAFQLLIYPATDLTRSHPSHTSFQQGYLLTSALIDWFMEQYLHDEVDRKHPMGSPLYAEDLRGLPPALLLTAGFDPLRDEGRAYADRLREAGVPVEYRCYEGMIHGFITMSGGIDEAARAVAHAAASLRRALRLQSD